MGVVRREMGWIGLLSDEEYCPGGLCLEHRIVVYRKDRGGQMEGGVVESTIIVIAAGDYGQREKPRGCIS